MIWHGDWPAAAPCRRPPGRRPERLHERVRLYRSQFPRIYRSFGYDVLGPMRRDFSIVLEQHDLDLDRALQDIQTQPDYSMADHARDLAGALRWNAVGVLRQRG